jgi:hypothetical protein
MTEGGQGEKGQMQTISCAYSKATICIISIYIYMYIYQQQSKCTISKQMEGWYALSMFLQKAWGMR